MADYCQKSSGNFDFVESAALKDFMAVPVTWSASLHSLVVWRPLESRLCRYSFPIASYTFSTRAKQVNTLKVNPKVLEQIVELLSFNF